MDCAIAATGAGELGGRREAIAGFGWVFQDGKKDLERDEGVTKGGGQGGDGGEEVEVGGFDGLGIEIALNPSDYGAPVAALGYYGC